MAGSRAARVREKGVSEDPTKEPIEERASRIKVRIELSELSSKQRGAVLGLIKDMGFTPEEIGELAVGIPLVKDGQAEGARSRRQKRK
jgi:hypothetical protein